MFILILYKLYLFRTFILNFKIFINIKFKNNKINNIFKIYGKIHSFLRK